MMFTRRQTAKQQQSPQTQQQQPGNFQRNQQRSAKFTNFVPAGAVGAAEPLQGSVVPVFNDRQQPRERPFVIDKFQDPAMNAPVVAPVKNETFDIPASRREESNGAAVKIEIDSNSVDTTAKDASEEDKKSSRPPWLGKKRTAGEGFKVDKKMKKKKFNAKLERAMKPKNALLIFNELNLKPEFKVQDYRREGRMHTVLASLAVGGQTYIGEATTASGAKLIAADLALKDIFTRMMKNSELAVDAQNSSMEVDEPGQNGIGFEPLPWSTIGAYALHLLFTRWEVGTTPTSNPPTRASSVSEKVPGQQSSIPRAPQTSTQLINYKTPDKARAPASIDTSQALYYFNLICPSVPVVESTNSENSDTQFGIKCQIEGVVYEAAARNKKDAKRKLAIQVLQKFGVKMNDSSAGLAE